MCGRAQLLWSSVRLLCRVTWTGELRHHDSPSDSSDGDSASSGGRCAQYPEPKGNSHPGVGESARMKISGCYSTRFEHSICLLLSLWMAHNLKIINYLYLHFSVSYFPTIVAPHVPETVDHQAAARATAGPSPQGTRAPPTPQLCPQPALEFTRFWLCCANGCVSQCSVTHRSLVTHDKGSHCLGLLTHLLNKLFISYCWTFRVSVYFK